MYIRCSGASIVGHPVDMAAHGMVDSHSPAWVESRKKKQFKAATNDGAIQITKSIKFIAPKNAYISPMA